MQLEPRACHPVADVTQMLEGRLVAHEPHLHGLDAHGAQVAEPRVGEIDRPLVADAELHPALAFATTRLGARAPGGVSPDFGVWSQRAVMR